MGSSPLHPFEARVDAAWPASSWNDLHVVLAVSGGADSVAMLLAAHALKSRESGRGRLHVAHLNHRLRQEADADAKWVSELCRKLDVSFDVGMCDVAAIAAREGDGWEAAARAARYEFLQRTAEMIGARFVATAHTADDQVETVLHRIVRGTGIAGLAGIRGVRPLSPSVVLVRPMLAVYRSEVLDYLASLGQGFRTDATNEDRRFTRNRLRHELLPALRQTINADVDAAILRLAGQAAETQRFIVEQAAALAAECVMADFARVEIDCGKCEREPAIVLREVFRIAWQRASWPEQSMGFEQWQQLAGLARGEKLQPINLPGNIRAEREGRRVTMNLIAGQ